MPRRKYRVENAPVPGVTTVIAVLDKPALKYWAFEQGKACERGEISNLYEKRDIAAEAGTLAHTYVEAYLRNEPEPSTDGLSKEIIEKAEGCYLGFLEWQRANDFKVIESELSLTSTKHKFGGTLDIGGIRGDFGIFDIKTSKDVYFSMKVQLAAYGILYEENHSEKVRGYHILRIGEDGGFSHHYWPNLDKEKEAFLHCLAIYKILKETKQRL